MFTIIEEIKNLKHRPSWDHYFILLAYLLSSRSSCKKLNVGCVIVRNNRSLTTGYNGHIKGADHTSLEIDGHEQMTIHAEINAITDAASNGISLNNSSIYITHFPCINCAKSIIQTKIKKIYYAEDYKNDELVLKLLNIANITIEKVTLY